LWLPAVSEGEFGTYLKTSKLSIENKSWYSVKEMNGPTPTDLQSASSKTLTSAIEGLEEEQIPTEPEEEETEPLKTRKIRLYPTPEQRNILNAWLGTTRWTYNRCLSSVKDKTCSLDRKKQRDLNVSDKNFYAENSWVRKTPQSFRDGALSDLLDAFKSNTAKFRNQGLEGAELKKMQAKFLQNMKFRSKKFARGSFRVERANWGSITKKRKRKKRRRKTVLDKNERRTVKARLATDEILKAKIAQATDERKYPKCAAVLRPHLLRASESLPERLPHTSRLLRDRGQFYLCIPVPLNQWVKRGENQTPKSDKVPKERGIAAIDPGVRTFATVYDHSENRVILWGYDDYLNLKRLCKHLDRLVSRTSSPSLNHHRRYNMKKAQMRLRRKIRNRVDELHRKLALWLCRNFRVVLLPHFDVSRLVKKASRIFGSSTARSMYTLSHFRFRQYLLHKVRQFPMCRVEICTEEYTSQHCGKCGTTRKVKGRFYECKNKQCGVVLERDGNAARNILLLFCKKHNLLPSRSIEAWLHSG